VRRNACRIRKTAFKYSYKLKTWFLHCYRHAPINKQTHTHTHTHTHHTNKTQVKPGVTVIRAVSSYSLPASVARVTAMVAELLRLPRVRHLPSSSPPVAATNATHDEDEDEVADPFSACGDVCAGFTTPTVLAQRYGFGDDDADAAMGRVRAGAAPGNAVGVAEFQLQYYDQRDLLRFGAQCGVDAVGVDKVG
jgi:hypothetical protein